MDKATMTVAREYYAGKQTVCVYVRGKIDDELRPVLDAAGYELVDDTNNCRRVRCTTPAELNAAREPLRPYFNAQGVRK